MGTPAIFPEHVLDNWQAIAGQLDGRDDRSMFELASDHDAERAEMYNVFGDPEDPTD